MDKLLLRPMEAAEIISVSRSRIYELVANKSIKSLRIGRSVRIHIDDLKAWIKEQTGDDSNAQQY